jgi:hypothetical protein
VVKIPEKATMKDVKSLVRDMTTNSMLFDKHEKEKLAYANNFMDLIYTETINALNFKPNDHKANPFGSYNAQPIVKQANELLVALDLSKNEKFMRLFHKYLNYLESDCKLNPLLTKQKLQRITEEFHVNMDINTHAYGLELKTNMDAFWKWANSIMQYADAEKRNILKAMKTQGNGEPEAK